MQLAFKMSSDLKYLYYKKNKYFDYHNKLLYIILINKNNQDEHLSCCR